MAELAVHYLHDALSDPRLIRLLAWRGLTEPTPATPPVDTDELDGIRRRQRAGELHTEVDPATLRLVLLGRRRPNRLPDHGSQTVRHSMFAQPVAFNLLWTPGAGG